MAPTGTVRARWVPLYGVDLPDGTHLEPGDVHAIPAGEAVDSEHWEPLKASPASKPTTDEGDA